MPFKRSTLRYAHTSGHAHCCYADNGDYVITTGSDGDIRIWNGVDDDDPNTRCVGEFILYHVYYDKRILASTDLNTVQGYTYPDGDRDGTEFRFTAPVTCIKVNDKYIAACSEDMLIKVVPKDKSSEFFELTGHEGPVFRIDLSTNGLLASSSGDGTLKIWDLDERKVVKTFSDLEKAKSYQATNIFVTPSFEPNNGRFMAYNDKQTVLIVDTQYWEIKKTLTDENSKADYTVCSYSTCGKYIAAGSTNGSISIWDIEKNRLVHEENRAHEAQCITAIDWNPQNNGELAYTDVSGQFGLVTNILDEDNNILERDEEIETNGIDDDVNFDDIEFDDPDDTDNENCVSLEKLKNETMGKTVEQEIDEMLDGNSNKTGIDDDKDDRSEIGPITKSYPMQPPFQPGATSKLLEHRYMVWNHVGIVRAHSTDNENSIEVEFHDSSVHHGLHMNNYLNHTMASLSTTVLALCSETPSKLVCIALGGSGGSREWSMPMPNCEEILCTAASEKLVAVASDARYVRLFSVMGTQREILSLAGPVLALAAHVDRVMVAYHSTPPSADQQISVLLIQTFGLSLRCRDVRVALTPGSKLTWIGFSDRGSPVTCDSMGMVRMYSMSSNYWIPICDTSLHTKGASDTYFIVEVSEAAQVIRGVLCRGLSYPLTTPKPMVSEIPIQLPLCDIESEQSQLEESLIRYSNFKADDSEKYLKENAIKLFAIACRSEMEARAKELIEILALPNLLPLAIKYASKLGRIHLAEKLRELLPQFEQEEKERNQYDEHESASNLLLNTPVASPLIQMQNNASPSVIPKPLTVSQLKRNPFKKTPQSANKFVKNPLRHLTDSAIGFDSQDSIVTDNDTAGNTESIEISQTESAASENINPNQLSSKPKFIDWHREHETELRAEKPDLTPADLTKYSMNKYRTLYSKSVNQSTNGISSNDDAGKSNGTIKRRIDAEGTKGQSGIAKLAKFSFNKQ